MATTRNVYAAVSEAAVSKLQDSQIARTIADDSATARNLAALLEETQKGRASEPLAEPTFAKATDKTTGVLSRVEPVHDVFLNARRSLEALRSAATERQNAADALLDRLLDFLDDYLSPEALARLGDARFPAGLKQKLLPEFHVAGKFTRPALDRALIKPGDQVEGEAAGIKHNDQSALFASGAVLVDDIRKIEALRYALIDLRRRHQALLEDKRAALAGLVARAPAERATLATLEGERVERLEDYLLAQRLLAEHWQEVESAHAARRKVIESHVGLYYVRVRETPLSCSLPDPLDLRSAGADDIVPGCANRDIPLPDALSPFMQAVLDVPVGDWAALRPLTSLLPGRAQLTTLVEARRRTLAARSGAVAGAATAGLAVLVQQNQGLVRELAGRPFGGAALSELQRQARGILGLDDLMASQVPLLRAPAQALHQRLDAAAGCLLERMRAISPSLRLAWATAAEADRLAVETPESWSGLATAEDADFNGVRTLVELVAWWFRQLDSDAAGSSRTAMRNLVRACLMLAASDDPQQILQGSLKTLPGRFRVGEVLRVSLNREPAAGALLQLFDDDQRVIGVLRVEDHDEQGTLVSIASVLDAAAPLATSLRVSGKRS